MSFFDWIKKFLLFTLKEIYSFFLKMTLFLGIVVFIGVASFTYLYTKYGEEEKINKNYSYVLFNPVGLSEDKFVDDMLLGRFPEADRYNVNYFDILASLNSIKSNDKIKGIIINLDEVSLSKTHTEEFTKKFIELKEKGKKIYAIGSYINNDNYLLASIANEIILFPTHSANFSLTGYYYSQLYFKDLLDKLGVNIEIVRIGDYKSFGENYNSDKISKGLKEEMTRILDNRFEGFLEKVSKNRNIDKGKLEREVLNGDLLNLSPFDARDMKLIDKLEYVSDFYKRHNISEENIIDIYDYYVDNKEQIAKTLKQADRDGTIAVLYMEGEIEYSEERYNRGASITPENVALKIEGLEKIQDLKGIVLRVNSPGGSALAAEMIYQMLSKLNVPIYVSMGSTAASGGYYISMAGDKVFANESTVTGSIGVVSMYPRFYKAQNKFGVKANSISKGKYAEIYDNFAPLSEDAKDNIRESMLNTYKEFKSRVTKNRKMDENKLEEYAQGRIWLGNEAKSINLVDDNATLEDTIKKLAEQLDMKNYNIENVYISNSLINSFRSLRSRVVGEFNIFGGVEKFYKQDVLDELEFIKANSNIPLYYLPNSELY